VSGHKRALHIKLKEEKVMQMNGRLIFVIIMMILSVAIIYFYEGEADLIGLAIFAVAEFLLVRERYLYRRR
jgi:uncharacterized membrane-anchored protein